MPAAQFPTVDNVENAVNLSTNKETFISTLLSLPEPNKFYTNFKDKNGTHRKFQKKF